MPNFNSKRQFVIEIMSISKLKIIGIFLGPRGITLPKIIRPDPASNLTCVYDI